MEPCFFSSLYCEDTQKSIAVAMSGHFLSFIYFFFLKEDKSNIFRFVQASHTLQIFGCALGVGIHMLMYWENPNGQGG